MFPSAHRIKTPFNMTLFSLEKSIVDRLVWLLLNVYGVGQVI